MKNLSSEGAFTWNCAKIQMFGGKILNETFCVIFKYCAQCVFGSPKNKTFFFSFFPRV